MTERLLQDRGKTDFRVEFHNRGVVGELTSDMLNRFQKDVVDLHPDYAIILGGSNDLGWDISPQSILKNLVEMYEEAVKHKIEPIACTVPSILGFDAGMPLRIELNGLIEGYCLMHGLICVDLFTATCDPRTKRLKEEFSNDGLHLNRRGYEAVAEVIFASAVRRIVLTRLGADMALTH